MNDDNEPYLEDLVHEAGIVPLETNEWEDCDCGKKNCWAESMWQMAVSGIIPPEQYRQVYKFISKVEQQAYERGLEESAEAGNNLVLKAISEARIQERTLLREKIEKTFNGCQCGFHGYYVLPDCESEHHGDNCARCILSTNE